MRGIISELHQALATLSSQSFSPSDWAFTPDRALGDIAIPCFKLSKVLSQAPAAIAQKFAPELATLCSKNPNTLVERIVATGPYINVFFKSSAAFGYLRSQLLTNTSQFGNSGVGVGKTVVIDFSSPNVAKEIALHHLRSTAIGNSLAHLAQLHGYKVVRLNYLGDWGTSFGKLIVGLELYGNESDLDSGGLSYMLDIYVRFNQAEKSDPALAQKARDAFSKLERGDESYLRIWKLFRDISIREFKKLYSRLGIEFDFFDGESLYVKALEKCVAEVESKIGIRVSEGATVCDLPGHKIPILLKKDDGASLYITRDLAAAEDRFNRFHFDLAWYVVAVQQKLHFQQLFDLSKALGKPYASNLEHIAFGMLSFGSKTMKSREGNVIFLKDCLDEAAKRALDIIKEKNAELANASATAELIGMGAVFFGDLSQHRTHDINFDWDKALSFEGDTAPFLQYTHARCFSLIHKGNAHLLTLRAGSNDSQALVEVMEHPAVRQLLGDLWQFEIYAERALNDRDPSQIAASLLNVAASMNQMYHKIRFLDESSPARLKALLELCQMTQKLLGHGLALLGIRAPEQM